VLQCIFTIRVNRSGQTIIYLTELQAIVTYVLYLICRITYVTNIKDYCLICAARLAPEISSMIS